MISAQYNLSISENHLTWFVRTISIWRPSFESYLGSQDKKVTKAENEGCTGQGHCKCYCNFHFSWDS